MEDRFGDVLVPTEEVVEMRSGQKRRSERKFFPGYVLVQITTHDEGGIPRIDSESWHLIKETPKVMGFIGGTADKPLPIRDDEARSEEHTSELQSLMRISYAVFCLKKKQNTETPQ